MYARHISCTSKPYPSLFAPYCRRRLNVASFSSFMASVNGGYPLGRDSFVSRRYKPCTMGNVKKKPLLAAWGSSHPARKNWFLGFIRISQVSFAVTVSRCCGQVGELIACRVMPYTFVFPPRPRGSAPNPAGNCSPTMGSCASCKPSVSRT